MNSENKITILIVDDNPQNLKVLGNILRGNGYVPVAAQNGFQALKFLQQEKPDLILLDIMMPEMDGYGVCEKLKKDERSKDIPVIFLTAKTEPEDLVRAFEAGGVDYVTKPFNSIELLVRVKSQLDLKKAEAELLKSEKLEMVGILSGGIAHDFNNLLAVIMGNLGLAKDSLQDPNPEALRFVERTEQSLNHAAELVKKFLTISEGGWIERTRANLPGILKDAVASVPQLKETPCTVSLPGALKPVYGDERQLRQVMVNLLLNSHDATSDMNKDKRISISAENITLPGDNQWSLPAGEYVKVSVIDNGKGIPEGVSDKIFDPYFSTKQRGNQKGMGMGLAVSYAVVQRHRGHLAVTSNPQEGTTVDLYLPATPRRGEPDSRTDTED
ncbi:MAG: response regulator [bacterium]|nr:response regulator [bacterium]